MSEHPLAGVVEELKSALGDLPHQSWEAYCWAHELYASPRMLLACLTRYIVCFTRWLDTDPRCSPLLLRSEMLRSIFTEGSNWSGSAAAGGATCGMSWRHSEQQGQSMGAQHSTLTLQQTYAA